MSLRKLREFEKSLRHENFHNLKKFATMKKITNLKKNVFYKLKVTKFRKKNHEFEKKFTNFEIVHQFEKLI